MLPGAAAPYHAYVPPERTWQAPAARKIAAEMKWQVMGQAGVQAAWYVMVLVLGALLPPTAFGTVAVGVTIVGIGNVLVTSGTGGSLVATRGLTQANVRHALRVIVGLALLVSTLICVLASPIVHVFAPGGNVMAVRVLAFNVTLAASAVVPNALLRRQLNFRRFSTNTALAALITAAAAIIAAAVGAGIWALVVRQMAYMALVVTFGWIAVRHALGDLPKADNTRTPTHQLPFLIASVSSFLAISMDNLVVGNATTATQLGYYAFAFSLAFAPLTLFAWQIGAVLMASAAATENLELVGARTLTALRTIALVLLPLVPPVVALAPVLVPAVLGHKWKPMVPVFQILLVVGVAHAMANTIGEALAGTGHISARARADLPWALGTLALIFVMVRTDGIQGAAVARLIVFVPLAWWYVMRGATRVCISPGQLWCALRPVIVPVLAQAAVTAATLVGLGAAGTTTVPATVIASLCGVAAVTVSLFAAPSKPLRDGQRMLALFLRQPIADRVTSPPARGSQPR